MVKELKYFEMKCKKCGSIAIIEIRESVSYRNDTFYEYPVAICKKCRTEEDLLE